MSAATGTAGPQAAGAEAVLALAQSDPTAAREQARGLLDACHDAVTRSLAHEALGLAAKEEQDLDDAVAHLREAVRCAEEAGLARRAAQARMSLCFALVSRGDTDAALRETALAGDVLEGADGARLQMRRGLVLQRLGRLDEALEAYDAALPPLRAAGDCTWEARLLTNRGVLHAYRHHFAAAERDLQRAERLYDEEGQRLASAQVRHNLGFVAALRGDIPAALQSYDRAAEALQALGIVAWLAEADRCELLLRARLLDEADALATRAVAQLARAGMDSDMAEARLTLANVKLLRGEPDEAARIAGEARDAFQSQHRRPWSVLAGYAVLRARWEAGRRSASLSDEARRVADDLEAAGWVTAAVDARLMAVRTALEHGDVEAAEQDLVRHRAARSAGPVELRARAWHAEALVRLAHGNRGGADAALRAGLRALDRHRATLGATELRAHVSGHVGELARLGLRLALESRSAARTLRWAERWRAGALHLRPMRPPDDEELVAELARLRETVADLDTAALAGRDTQELQRRQAALEQSIQRRSRHAQGSRRVAPETCDVPDVVATLGDRVLVEMVRLDDALHAVVVGAAGLRLRHLGSQQEAVRELEHLRFALRRLRLPGRSAGASSGAEASARASAARLDEMLLGPVRADVGDRPLVLVPTGALHAVPWGALPTCVGRPVSVAPSALLWCRAASRPHGGGSLSAVLVGAADPPHAEQEVRALQERYRDATVLVGAEATVGAVGAALDGADLAHLACHGRFRTDNPLFSSLQLADGPLTVFDLERRRRVPELLLLSACESGLSAVHAGDELIGLAGTLFALGTRTLVASVAAVPDGATRRLMVDFHDRLRAGEPPASALAACQAGAGQAAAGFVCFGAG